RVVKVRACAQGGGSKCEWSELLMPFGAGSPQRSAAQTLGGVHAVLDGAAAVHRVADWDGLQPRLPLADCWRLCCCVRREHAVDAESVARMELRRGAARVAR